MSSTYENDIVAWANEQAYLLRSGKLSAIDIEHIAEEIEDVGKKANNVNWQTAYRYLLRIFSSGNTNQSAKAGVGNEPLKNNARLLLAA